MIIRINGHISPTRLLQNLKICNKVCIKNNGAINFAALDAANDFNKFSNEVGNYECEVEFEKSI